MIIGFFSGGGVKNVTLMSDIKALLKNEKIIISDKIGFDSSFVESSAFAYISIRTIKNLPSAFPKTTGCSKKMCVVKFINLEFTSKQYFFTFSITFSSWLLKK